MDLYDKLGLLAIFVNTFSKAIAKSRFVSTMSKLQ